MTCKLRRTANIEAMGEPGQARPEVLDRARTPRGEIVLRRHGAHHEIISNGVFLMDTRGGESEQLLVRAPLGRVRAPARVLLGGLGVGFSLVEALRQPAVRQVTVVELEPAVIDWHATELAGYSAGALADPRVRVVCADLASWLAGSDGDERFDVICLDIDNGPDWTVSPANAWIYTGEGLELLARRLSAGGMLAVWSSHASPAFECRCREVFATVAAHRVEAARGEPDVVYVAALAFGRADVPAEMR